MVNDKSNSYMLATNEITVAVRGNMVQMKSGWIIKNGTVLSNIRGMEQRKEGIIINGEKIKQLCEQMISDDNAFERKRKRNC